jgi:peroxiredoxin-like protein
MVIHRDNTSVVVTSSHAPALSATLSKERLIMTTQSPHFYETEVVWVGERIGELRSPGLPTIEVTSPPEFQGHAGVWTPENLFVASVNACFLMTFLAIAELSKLDFVSISAAARGRLEKVEGAGYQITELVLKPKLVVRFSRDVERAGRLLEKAEKNCFISNSIKTRIALEPEVMAEQVES